MPRLMDMDLDKLNSLLLEMARMSDDAVASSRARGKATMLIPSAGICTLWLSGPLQLTTSLTYYFYYVTSFSNWIGLAWSMVSVSIVTVVVINVVVLTLTMGGRAHA